VTLFTFAVAARRWTQALLEKSLMKVKSTHMQKISRKTIVLYAGLAAAIAIAFAALRIQGQNNSTTAQKENPSPVQEGVMTGKQREHSKLFSQKYAYRRNQKLRDLTGHGDLEVMIGIGDKPRSTSALSFNLNEFVRNMTCDSDVVLTGQVKDKVSQLTENGEFTFTDYEITVEDILKNNAAATVYPQSNITVVRPGGAIQFNGRVIRGIDLSYKPFELGSRVLLFLKFIPATGAYKTLRSDGSFALVGNELVKLTEEKLPADLENEKDALLFINRIRNQAVNTCGR
jgi:hypothetical protein